MQGKIELEAPPSGGILYTNGTENQPAGDGGELPNTGGRNLRRYPTQNVAVPSKKSVLLSELLVNKAAAVVRPLLRAIPITTMGPASPISMK